MSTTRLLIHPVFVGACVLALVIIGVNVARSAAPAVPAAAPTSVAVVNLERLFNGLNELADRNAKVKQERDAYRAELNADEAKIKAAESELKDVIPVTERSRRAAKGAELNALRNIYKVKAEQYEAMIELKNVEIIRELYNKTVAGIGAFASREGYDIVLLDDRGITIPEVSSEERINSVILNKRVLYARPELDITDRLITVMNSEYSSGASGRQ